MRYLTILLFLFQLVSTALAGESSGFADPSKPKVEQTFWEVCRLTIARPGRPMGSLDIVVYTSLMPRGQINESDYNFAFAAYVEKTYGVRGGAECGAVKSEAEAQHILDFWTTNKADPSQITVIKTGWTYP